MELNTNYTEILFTFDVWHTTVAHNVLLSYNVNMQGIGLMFVLQEIFDVAHYDTRIIEFEKI